MTFSSGQQADEEATTVIATPTNPDSGDQMARAVVSSDTFDGYTGMSVYLMTGKEMRQWSVLNTLTMALGLGNELAAKPPKPIDTCLDYLKKYDHKAEEVEITAGGGTYNTQKYNAFAGHSFGDIGLALNVNYMDTDGQDEILRGDVAGQTGELMFDTEKWDTDLKLSYMDLSFQAHYAQRKSGPYVGIVNALNDESEQKYTDWFAELKYDTQLNDETRMQARGYYDFYQLDNFWELFSEGFGMGAYPDGVLTRSAADDTKTGLEITVHHDLTENNKVVVGAWVEEQEQDNVIFEANFDPLTFAPLGSYQTLPPELDWTREVTREVWAIYAEDIWDINEDLRAIVGARYDDYSDYGGTFNPRASLAYEVIDDITLQLSYGSAFRDPTFAELYNINNPAILGNPDLDPETIDTYEVGVSGKVSEDVSFRMTGFYNDIKDIITPVANESAAAVSDNRGKITVQGLETEVRLNFEAGGMALAGSHIGANYTYQDAENDVDGSTVADTPTHRGNILLNIKLPQDINWHTQCLLKDSTARAVGDDRPEPAGYGVVNTTLRFNNIFGQEGLELRASVYNLFDKNYVNPSPAGSTMADFPNPGRVLYAEVSYPF